MTEPGAYTLAVETKGGKAIFQVDVRHARRAALALTADYPSHFDVKCNVGCEARDATKWPCPGLAYDATMRKIYADNSSIRDPKFYTEPDYANYKYVLNLPGKTDGSYSRNLNHLWYVGAAVLLWDTPAVEWYYYPCVEIHQCVRLS